MYLSEHIKTLFIGNSMPYHKDNVNIYAKYYNFRH